MYQFICSYRDCEPGDSVQVSFGEEEESGRQGNSHPSVYEEA